MDGWWGWPVTNFLLGRWLKQADFLAMAGCWQFNYNDLYPSYLIFLPHSWGKAVLYFDKSFLAAVGDAFLKLFITCLPIFPRLHPSWKMASANWSRIGPCLRCLWITTKKLVKDETSGSISLDDRIVWKQLRARSKASFFPSSSSSSLVNAHAKVRDD